MPQMAPMWWLMLMMLFLIMFIYMMVYTYFFLLNLNIIKNKKNFNMEKFIWKW